MKRPKFTMKLPAHDREQGLTFFKAHVHLALKDYRQFCHILAQTGQIITSLTARLANTEILYTPSRNAQPWLCAFYKNILCFGKCQDQTR